MFSPNSYHRPLRSLWLYLLIWAVASVAPLQAQNNCLPPVATPPPPSLNIFSEQQESDLGDAIAEQVQREYAVIDAPEVTGYLQHIAERLIPHLPSRDFRYRFFVVDINDLNAFVLPGGRVYVTRKMVAFVRDEDELAGVIAHELGHLIARHHALDLTFLFREVLGVDTVGDRRDIFEKYHQLIENIGRKPKIYERLQNHEDTTQNVADLIGLYAMAQAGYNPQAQADLWDRYHQTRGNTGGFFANLFGRLKPEQKRLRTMLKGLEALPASCRGTATSGGDAKAFQEWQAQVLVYNSMAKKESLRGLVGKKALAPALRSEITHARFSPDGKYLLAQDDSGINVLTREPFAPLFRIDSWDANPAYFSADSQEIIFYTSGLRVEVWDIAAQKLKTAHELVIRNPCLQTALAPNGQTLACLDKDFALNLYEVATNTQFFQKKEFFKPQFSDLLEIIANISFLGEAASAHADLIRMEFSPDSHYFVAGDISANSGAFGGFFVNTAVVALDLNTRAPAQIKGETKHLLGNSFIFLSPDRILGLHTEDRKKSGIYTFPDGKLVEAFVPGVKLLGVATTNSYVIGSVKEVSQLLFNLNSKKLFGIKQQKFFDVYDDVVISEHISGSLGLYSLKGLPPQYVELPPNPLGRLYANDLSPDFKWLAVSGASRGALWNLETGERLLHLRGFRGAYFAESGILYAEFPKKDEEERNVAQVELKTLNISRGKAITQRGTHQYSAYILSFHTAAKDDNQAITEGKKAGVVLEVSDARDSHLLWSATYDKDMPFAWLQARSNLMVLTWPVVSPTAQEEIKANPTLSQQLQAMQEPEGDYYLKVLDAQTGQLKGQLLVETGNGSFRLKSIRVAGNWVILTDNANRTLVYSLLTGQLMGRIFGRAIAVSETAKLLAAINESGQINFYTLPALNKYADLIFRGPVAMVNFSPDGKRLLVLTAKQEVYLFDTARLANEP